MTEIFNGAKVALYVGAKLLTLQRDDIPTIPFPGMWDLPGGGREGDETPFETMARETLEEVSLIVPPESVIWEKKYMWSSMVDLPSWFFVARLPATLESQIALGDEGQAWQLIDDTAYLTLPGAIPNLVSRLQDWLKVADRI